MALLRVWVCCLLLCTSVVGEIVDSPDDEKSERWVELSLNELPSGVEPQDPEDPDRPLTTILVRKVDVDGDGAIDLIVSTDRGGTGGSYVFVYRREGKRYREVLAEQGGIVVRPKTKGVARIECWSRIGGGQQRRTVYRFNGRRFVKEYTQALRERDDGRFEVIEREKTGAH